MFKRSRPRASFVRPLLDALRRTYSLPVEMAILASTFVVWQILRIPFEGTRRESLAHARDWLDAERALHLDVEPSLIRFVNEHGRLHDLADLAYGNLHVAVVVGLLAAARLRVPSRYPLLRTTFVLMHVPALVVLAVYPLAPPKWLTDIPFATGPPTDLEPLRNLTAAAVSLHFGYTVFVVGVALSLWPRSPLAWASVLYPALIFVVIVGTGNHYVLDAVVGAACVGLAFAAAPRIHGRQPRAGTDPAPASARTAALVGLGVALVGLAANGVATGSLRPGV